jgi:hypothetical protein
VAPSVRAENCRGEPSSASISPNTSPGPSARTRSIGWPITSLRTTTPPWDTTYSPSHSSSLRNTIVFGSKLFSSAVASSSASHSSGRLSNSVTLFK